MIALPVLSGCRWLSPKSSVSVPAVSPIVNTPPPVHTPTPSSQTEVPDRYEAFRPIMTEPFVPPVSPPVRTVPVQPDSVLTDKSEPQLSEPKSDPVDQTQIDELKKEVAELKTQLAEETKKRQDSPEVSLVPVETPQKTEAEVDETKELPIINKPGVTVSSDKLQRVRIEVMDKFLFMPNTWQLMADGEETLRTIAAEIRAFDPEVDLDIEGHTDSLMSDPKNLIQKHDISSDKAKVVMNFFVNTLHWDVARIGMSSYGRSRPIADNGTPEGRDRNNRIEIVLRKRSK